MKIRIPMMLTAVLAIFMAACKHDDAPSASYTTAVDVVNASLQTANFYLNGTRLNNTGNLSPGSSSGYFNVTIPGPLVSLNYQFKVPNTTTVILNLPLKLDTNAITSIFITGTDGKQGFALTDSIPSADTLNTAFVRFINASPNGGTLKLAIGDTVKFSSVAYQSESSFSRIGPGAKTIKMYSSDGTLVKTLTSPILVANTSYTFFAADTVKTTTNTAGVTVHSMVN